MTRPSPREENTIADRRRRVSEMYLQGFRQSDISRRLGVDQSTISRDLAAIRAVWQEQRTVDYGEKVDAELARLDAVQSAAWTAWERSKLAKKKRGQRGTVKFTEAEKQGAGNPRFLEVIRKCVVDRARLLGLPIESQNQTPQRQSSEEQRAAHKQLMEAIRARGFLDNQKPPEAEAN